MYLLCILPIDLELTPEYRQSYINIAILIAIMNPRIGTILNVYKGMNAVVISAGMPSRSANPK